MLTSHSTGHLSSWFYVDFRKKKLLEKRNALSVMKDALKMTLNTGITHRVHREKIQFSVVPLKNDASYLRA